MKRKHGDSCFNPDEPLSKSGKLVDEKQIWRPAFIVQQEMELRMIMDNLVKVYEKLDCSNNPDAKPNYSYSEVVYLALLRSDNFCLPLSEIYRYMRTRFTYFRNTEKTNWRNAVRHSLSKTKCFGKITVGRGLTVNGKHERSTNLWCIEPKSIASFARGDYRCAIDKASGTNTLRMAYFRVGNAGMFWDKVGTYLQLKKDSFVKKLSQTSNPGKTFESQICRMPEKFDYLISENNQSSVQEENDIKGFGYNSPLDSDEFLIENMYSKSLSDDSGNSSLSDSSRFETSSILKESSPELFGHSDVVSRSRNLMVYPSNTPSPELPDLGNVSPLSLSPVPSFGLEQSSPVSLDPIAVGSQQSPSSFLTNNTTSRNVTPPPAHLMPGYYPQAYVGGSYGMPSMYGMPYASMPHYQGMLQHSTPHSATSRSHGTNFVDQYTSDMGFHTFLGTSTTTNELLFSSFNMCNES